jgi:Domain of unknown function (DUF4926)
MKLPNVKRTPVTCYKTSVQKAPVKLLDVVALLEDKPAERLVAGQVGTVVELLAPGVFEVEFLDANGKTVALAELKRAELLVLKHEAVPA